MIQNIAQTGDICGEGAVWHPRHQAVYWTDINRGLIHRLALADSQVQTWHFDQPVTALTLTTDPNLLLAVLGGRIILWSPVAGELRTLHTLPDWPTLRANDARVDPTGALWFGTMQNNVAPDGSTKETTEHIGELICLSPSGDTRSWHQNLGIQNTIAWSPDSKTMYFGDTLANTIYAADYAARSIISIRPFATGFPRGLPDGSTMDAEGHLWNCRYGGACIVRFTPTGEVDRVVETPVENPTTCTFGGPALGTLYFTSAGNGGLYSFEPGVQGLPSTPYSLTES